MFRTEKTPALTAAGFPIPAGSISIFSFPWTVCSLDVVSHSHNPAEADTLVASTTQFDPPSAE